MMIGWSIAQGCILSKARSKFDLPFVEMNRKQNKSSTNWRKDGIKKLVCCLSFDKRPCIQPIRELSEWAERLCRSFFVKCKTGEGIGFGRLKLLLKMRNNLQRDMIILTQQWRRG